jgi:hypothetical protein
VSKLLETGFKFRPGDLLYLEVIRKKKCVMEGVFRALYVERYLTQLFVGFESKVTMASTFDDPAIASYMQQGRGKKERAKRGKPKEHTRADHYVAYLQDALLLVIKMLKSTTRMPDTKHTYFASVRACFSATFPTS